MTFVYGPPSSHGKVEFWQLLNSLSPNCDETWFCVGDFNDILCHSEKQGGSFRSSMSMLCFKDG